MWDNRCTAGLISGDLFVDVSWARSLRAFSFDIACSLPNLVVAVVARKGIYVERVRLLCGTAQALGPAYTRDLLSKRN